MRTFLRDVIRHTTFLLTLVLIPSLLSSQSTQATPSTPLPEDNLSPADFTTILKEAWTFLKDETDNYAKTVGKKTEFETTAEFEKRTIGARQQYFTKVTKFIKDKKFDQRVIGVILKADLEQYDADNQIYSIACPVQFAGSLNRDLRQCLRRTRGHHQEGVSGFVHSPEIQSLLQMAGGTRHCKVCKERRRERLLQSSVQN
jgi:hypothetical protein